MLAITQIIADAYYEDYWNPTNKLFTCTACTFKEGTKDTNLSHEVNAKLKISHAHKRVDYPLQDNDDLNKSMELTLYPGM